MKVQKALDAIVGGKAVRASLAGGLFLNAATHNMVRGARQLPKRPVLIGSSSNMTVDATAQGPHLFLSGGWHNHL
jgi:hypothetical protein